MEKIGTVDVAKVWQQMKDQLIALREEAALLLDQGEKAFTSFAPQKHTSLEALFLRTKRDQLLSSLGNEAFDALRKSALKQPRLTKIMKEIQTIDKQLVKHPQKKK